MLELEESCTQMDRFACWHKLSQRNAWENRVKTDVRMLHDRDKDGCGCGSSFQQEFYVATTPPTTCTVGHLSFSVCLLCTCIKKKEAGLT
jgi:hypothetical protein